MSIHAPSRVSRRINYHSFVSLQRRVLFLNVISLTQLLENCHFLQLDFQEYLALSSSVEVAMQFPILLPGALSDLFAQATISGCITKADRYGLMAALLEEELGSEEISVINRLLRAVYRGRLAIADELSAVV